MEQFAIYTRASAEGEDGPSSSPEDQEAAARAWADRNDVEVVDVVHETASGGSDASDHALGKLIDRCEAGELNGIIVRDEKRSLATRSSAAWRWHGWSSVMPGSSRRGRGSTRRT